MLGALQPLPAGSRSRVLLAARAVVELVATALIGGCAYGLTELAKASNADYYMPCFGFLFILSAIVEQALTQLRQPYLLRFVRNPLFSWPRLQLWIDRCLLFFYMVIPLPATAFLCIYLYDEQSEEDHVIWWQCVLVNRAMRWSWQEPMMMLMDLAVECAITAPARQSWLQGAGWGPQCPLSLALLIVSLGRSWAYDLAEKLHFIVISVYVVLTEWKLRFRFYRVVLAAELALLPLAACVILAAVVLSAPLVPFLGIPLFLLGFPRPQRSWYRIGSHTNGSADVVYYAQLLPRLLHTLQHDAVGGAAWALVKQQLGAPMNVTLGYATPGTMYLMRYETRTVIVQVVERGRGYLVFVTKGLELTPTSCHNEEGLVIDEIFDQYENAEPGRRLVLNKYPLHCMTPVTDLVVHTYSISKMSLVGILDHPDNLKKIGQWFWKTLVWVLVGALAKDPDFIHRHEDIPPAVPVPTLDLGVNDSGGDGDEKKKFSSEWYHLVRMSLAKNGCAADEHNFEVFVGACYALVETYGCEFGGPAHACSVFAGEMPTTAGGEISWFDGKDALKRLVLRAYRYACKLAVDEAVTYACPSDEELIAVLSSFDVHSFIGPIACSEWQKSVLDERELLFGLAYDRDANTCSAVNNTLTDARVHVGKLNSEAVRATWALLALELLYFTNDDDERYSIQAQKYFFRNIMIQASEPPFGYAAYQDVHLLPASVKKQAAVALDC
eukprot:TRINITY_DN1949_c0_g1_i2.p1 TRINITY_DN1949_c0_g1~~TRINITY_DN1949_c0_g1_i2.p1  ORF type:complete len:724 (-),score=161.24 TRINITY_DN1949_c0_g1_i2:58-2229(-)